MTGLFKIGSEEEIKKTGDYLEYKIKERFKGVLGLGIRKVAKMLFNWVMRTGVIPRLSKNFEFVLDSCKELENKDFEKVAEERLDGYMKTNELYMRANKKCEKIKELEKLLKDEFISRLKIYSKMMLSKGESYPELVRNAYHRKAELKELIRKEFEVLRRIVSLLEKERELIKIPSGIRSPLFKIMWASVEIMEGKVLDDVEHIYKKGK